MADLELLLREYGETFDERCPSVEADEIVPRSEGAPVSSAPRRSRWRLVAAAVVLLVVGSVVAIAMQPDDGPDVKVDQAPETVDSTPAPIEPSALVDPDTWSVAARISPELLEELIAATADGTDGVIESIDDIAALIRENSNAVEVLVVDADVSSWTAAMGETGAFGCDPTCVPGVVVWTDAFDGEGTETVLGMFLSSWWIGVPDGDVIISPVVEAEAVAVAEQRLDQVREELDTYLTAIRQPPREPRFDTSPLGSEQLIEAVPSAPLPEDDRFLDFGCPDPTDGCAGFASRAVDDDVVAYVVHLDTEANVDPLTATIDRAVLRVLGGTEPGPSPARINLFLRRAFDDRAPIGGWWGAVELFGHLADPLAGDRYLITAGARWADGVAAVAMGGLSTRVAVVATDLPDGTPVWQRPVQGIVMFTARVPETGALDLPEWQWGAPLVGYDADGNELFREE